MEYVHRYFSFFSIFPPAFQYLFSPCMSPDGTSSPGQPSDIRLRSRVEHWLFMTVDSSAAPASLWTCQWGILCWHQHLYRHPYPFCHSNPPGSSICLSTRYIRQGFKYNHAQADNSYAIGRAGKLVGAPEPSPGFALVTPCSTTALWKGFPHSKTHCEDS